jgi:hypothetical protein
MTLKRRLAASAVMAIALSACSGDGIGNGYAPRGAQAQNERGATRSGSLSGRVVDGVSGKGIAGATVVVSPEAFPGATPPPQALDVPRATTNATGYFRVRDLQRGALRKWSWKYVSASLPVIQHPQWVEVWANDGGAHAVYHGFQTVRYRAANDVGTVTLLDPTADELAWAKRVGYDRAHVGVPTVTVPLHFDNVSLAAGRRWAAYMAANKWFAHQCPPPNTGYAPCVETWAWEIANHGLPSAEDVAAGFADWRKAESSFMAERANCPHADWKTCPYAETTGHYINIMAATAWLGLGEASTSSGYPFWDMEFTGPAGVMSSNGRAYEALMKSRALRR